MSRPKDKQTAEGRKTTEEEPATEPQPFLKRIWWFHGTFRRLTVKLRGRAEAPTLGAEGAQFLSARGDNPEAHHGPLQRLLEDAPIEATVRARSFGRKPAAQEIRLSAPPRGERSHGQCSINDYLLRRAPRSQPRALRAHPMSPNEGSWPSLFTLAALAATPNLGCGL